MATDEKIPTQEEKMASIDDCKPATLNGTSTLLDFSELTPRQFGISVESFVPTPRSNHKDKSHLAQLKARRRSNVGVRGSPETNSLIRFIAQQRMKTPLTSRTPELVRSSPLVPRFASTLRQKMASFQSLMDVEENDACDQTPAQDSDTERCIMTRDYPSDGFSGEGKENDPLLMSTPTKRLRLGPPEGCSVQITEGNADIPHSSLKDVIRSTSRLPADEFTAASLPQQSSPFHIGSLHTLLERKPAENVSKKTPGLKRKKQVHFGDLLSPEVFDKNLPPSTPLQKGGTPARSATPGGGLELRSVLKTPQREDDDMPNGQMDLHSPAKFDGSPVLTIPRHCGVSLKRYDGGDGKIVFPAIEELDSAVTDSPFDTQPLNLDMAFHEELLSSIKTELDSSKTSQMDGIRECEPLPDKKQPEAALQSPTAARPRRGRKKNETKSKSTSPTCSSKRKWKPEENESVKRSTRIAAESARGKMKAASSPARRWKKDVDRSLYGSREYASKNPTLSPITERRPSISQAPPAPPTPEHCPELVFKFDIPSDTGVKVDQLGMEAAGSSSADSSHLAEDSQPSRSTDRGGGQEVEKVSKEAQEGEPEQHIKEPICLSESHNEEPGAQVSAQSLCDASVCRSSSPCPHPLPPSEEPSEVEPMAKKVKRGRRSSAWHKPLLEAEEQSSCETNQLRLKEQQDNGHEHIHSSSNSREEVVGTGGASQSLAPWQANLNFEDVFKRVSTRGQRAVRRSLRNQDSSELDSTGAGLAWIPRTSPESLRETRRKTRRLSAALPAALLPEETAGRKEEN